MSTISQSIKKIGLFSLSGIADDKRISRGTAVLQQLGIQYSMPQPNTPPLRYMAADDEERLRIFHQLLTDKSIDALMALRGGFGVTRILDEIDWELMRSRNIPIIGFSDVTALHLAALKHGCCRHVHGPMLCSTLGRKVNSNENKAAFDATLDAFAKSIAGIPCPTLSNITTVTLKPGKATGRFIPCNLSMLCALLGTPHLPSLKGVILGIEDVNEAAHKIDRMLAQLKSAGILKQLAGLVFGQFTNGEDAEYLPDIFADYASSINGPVIAGLPFGHDFPVTSIRVGATVILDTQEENIIRQAPMDAYEPCFFQNSGTTLGYRLLPPLNQEQGRKYPLVLLLHGAGERGEDNYLQLFHVARKFVEPQVRSDYPCFVAVPQCPERMQWVNTPWNLPKHDMPEQISEPLAQVMELIDSLTNTLPIDTSRIYLVGISMGGYAVWDTIQRFPKKFAAATPICGGGDANMASRLTQMPIWAFHGAKDTVVPTNRSIDMVEAVNAAGGHAKLTIFPDTYHDSWNKAIDTPELLPWMFAQKNTQN